MTIGGNAGYGFGIGLLDNDMRSLQSLEMMFDELIERSHVQWKVTTGEEAERLCGKKGTRPDILLVDMSLQGMQGPTVCRRIRERLGVMPILAMTAFPVELYCDKARQAGAQGIVSKNSESELVGGINELMVGRTYGEGFETVEAAHERVVAERRDSTRNLTRQEIAVMDYVAENNDDDAIAAALGISVATVRKHIQNAKRKLHARNRFQAALMWLKGEDW